MGLSADLSGKRALITGASSAGFGRYFATSLADAGAHVIATARRKGPLNELKQQIESSGGSCSTAVLDVTDIQNVRDVIGSQGPFDIVVNNAGVSVPKPILDQTDEDYEFVLKTNLKGVWNVGKECARVLKDARKSGSIINIASITGIRQVMHISPYAASKAAVIHLTKQMALEFARYDIRVNAIAPGWFESDLTRDFFDTDEGKALVKRVPMRRLGDYESLGGSLMLLASDASSFMTGSVIAVDGGHLLGSL